MRRTFSPLRSALIRTIVHPLNAQHHAGLGDEGMFIPRPESSGSESSSYNWGDEDLNEEDFTCGVPSDAEHAMVSSAKGGGDTPAAAARRTKSPRPSKLLDRTLTLARAVIQFTLTSRNQGTSTHSWPMEPPALSDAGLPILGQRFLFALRELTTAGWTAGSPRMTYWACTGLISLVAGADQITLPLES
jgi:hypothetical protein